MSYSKRTQFNRTNCTRTAAAFLAVVCLLCGRAMAINDLVAEWTFENSVPASAGPFSAESGSGDATGFHAGTTVYSNPSGNGNTESFSSNGWAAGDYYQFQTSTLGLSSIGLQFDQVSSTTGPRDFTLQYSTNGTTFTNFASYSVQPNATPNWGASEVQPFGLDTYVFDLRSIAALNNAANIYLRLTASNPVIAAQPGSTAASTGTNRVDDVTIFNNFDPSQSPVQQPLAAPVLPQAGDVVLGLSAGRPKTTLDLVRGTAVANGGAEPAPLAPWQGANFIQFPRFDNLGGVKHNVSGNLIGVDAGTAAAGGKIYNLPTQGAVPSSTNQLIGNSTGTGGAGLTLTRFGGPSVSPNNTKIAVTGFDSGKVIVYDYTAGNTMGAGASLTGARETATTPLATAVTQGTAWLNDNIVLAFSSTGQLHEVDATSMADSLKTTVTTGSDTSQYTSLAYNPDVSPYVYAMYGGFTSTTSTTNNQLYILDPANGYNLVKQLDLSSSADTAREIVLDKDGNLFISQNGSKIDFLTDVVSNPGALSDNSSQDWYTSTTFASFVGFDIGYAAASVTGDYNGDGKVNAADYVIWRNDPAGHGGNPAGYTAWRANFGAGGPGSGVGTSAAVPEPTSLALLLLGLSMVGIRRR